MECCLTGDVREQEFKKEIYMKSGSKYRMEYQNDRYNFKSLVTINILKRILCIHVSFFILSSPSANFSESEFTNL